MHFKLKSISSVLAKSTVNNTDLLEMLLTGPKTLRGKKLSKQVGNMQVTFF